MQLEERITQLIENYIERIYYIKTKNVIDTNDQNTLNKLYTTVNYLAKQLITRRN